MKNWIFSFVIIIFFYSCAGVTKNASDSDVKFIFAGDVMLDWGIRDIVEQKGYKYPLEEIRDFLMRSDYRFCNLECPISDEGEAHVDKKYLFLANPDMIEVLKYANINGVSLANNHSNDFGKTALLNTMTNLYMNGISFAGAGTNIGSAHLPISIEIKNIKIALFAYSQIAYVESYATEKTPGIARASIDLIQEDISQFRSFHDYIIVSLHWGDEYSEYPADNQIEFAHSIIDSGADIIIGHHPHVFQGIEIYNQKPIFYSLGNFIFGSINEDIQDNILVEIKFGKSEIKSFTVYPINGNKSNDRPFQCVLLKAEDAIENLNKILNISKHLQSDFTHKAAISDASLIYRFL